MWTDDLPEASLRSAVASSTSWRGVLRHLGRTSPRTGRLLKARCDQLGISYRHFVGGGGRCSDPEQLRAALSAATSWPALLDDLGYSPSSGSARGTLRKQALEMGLDVSHLGSHPYPQVGGAFACGGGPADLRRAAPLIVAARCTLLGHDVSWPLEPKPYDLLVDTAQEGLLRVQVKSGTRRSGGSWIAWITRSDRRGRVGYSAEEIDYFGVVSGDRAVYMIPVHIVEGQSSVCLRAYEKFRIES